MLQVSPADIWLRDECDSSTYSLRKGGRLNFSSTGQMYLQFTETTANVDEACDQIRQQGVLSTQ